MLDLKVIEHYYYNQFKVHMNPVLKLINDMRKKKESAVMIKIITTCKVYTWPCTVDVMFATK